MANPQNASTSKLPPLPNLIFASRWLQLPLYLGLILAQAVYVFHFWVELTHLIEAAFGNNEALTKLVGSIGYKSSVQVTNLNETIIMLVVLALIDVVMISNLLIMVIVGGYETFVSRMGLQGHPDQPEGGEGLADARAVLPGAGHRVGRAGSQSPGRFHDFVQTLAIGGRNAGGSVDRRSGRGVALPVGKPGGGEQSRKIKIFLGLVFA